jgi:hypothetical protein
MGEVGDHRIEELVVDQDRLADSFEGKQTLFAMEGGVVYTGTFSGSPCLVVDEGVLVDFPLVDRKSGGGAFTVRIFASDGHRRQYIEDRGWTAEAERWRVGRLARLRSHIDDARREGGLALSERDDLLARLEVFEKGRRPGGLDERYAYLLPERLDFSITESMSGSGTSVEWTGEALLCQRREGHSTRFANAAPRPYEFQPRVEEWRAFWRQLGRLRAWGWSRSEPGDDSVMDGSYYSLSLGHRGKHLEIGGSVEGVDPSESRFARFAPALERLLDGWPV